MINEQKRAVFFEILKNEISPLRLLHNFGEVLVIKTYEDTFRICVSGSLCMQKDYVVIKF